MSLAYVLITPARNEAQFIRLTLESMVAQTVRPLKWVIVSDGSTDGTDDIVDEYVRAHPWIELIRMPERQERHFAGKVHAFNAGYARVAGLPYEVIGNLDGDVSFEPDYLEFVLNTFLQHPRLGVSGTPFKEREGNDNAFVRYDYRFTSLDHVSGQCQLFRRQCFDDIGGYIPRKVGGIDLIAVISARMKGWQTRCFVEKAYVHHRPMSTATQHWLAVPLRGGRTDYILGNHPLWHLCRCLYQMTRRPFVVGGGLRLAGYAWAVMRRLPKEVPPELVRFRRQEQMKRLSTFLRQTTTRAEAPLTARDVQDLGAGRRDPSLSARTGQSQ